PPPPAEPPPAEPPARRPRAGDALNLSILLDLHKLRPQGVQELVENFLAGAERRVEAIQRSAERADSLGLERAAHSLKGSCGTLGAMRMAQLCARLVEKARGGETDAAQADVEALVVEHGRVQEAFGRQLEEWTSR
ncbi:MAG: Hpt domain-containing protein, partial [Acidobacteriota bacterium]